MEKSIRDLCAELRSGRLPFTVSLFPALSYLPALSPCLVLFALSSGACKERRKCECEATRWNTWFNTLYHDLSRAPAHRPHILDPPSTHTNHPQTVAECIFAHHICHRLGSTSPRSLPRRSTSWAGPPVVHKEGALRLLDKQGAQGLIQGGYHGHVGQAVSIAGLGACGAGFLGNPPQMKVGPNRYHTRCTSTRLANLTMYILFLFFFNSGVGATAFEELSGGFFCLTKRLLRCTLMKL